MKALWRGYITLGQLGIPIRLYAATRASGPHFVRLHDKDGSPVERVLRCRKEAREIDYAATVRAVERNGEYIAITDQELARTTPSVKAVQITQFCDKAALAPIYYEKSYYAAPAHGGARTYALLREVLVRTDKLALAQFFMHTTEHIGTLSVHEDMLLLTQLRYATSVVPRKDIKTPALPKPHPDEVQALQAVVERFSGPIYMEDYHDAHAERLETLVARKIKGLGMPRPEKIDTHATHDENIMPILNHLRGTQTLDRSLQ